jgi:uncharacterized membrane protein
MNKVLWVLQGLAGLLYGASGVMKVFFFEQIRGEVPSFAAMPPEAWMTLGIIELLCAAGLVLPSAFKKYPFLTVVAASVLAVESLVFIWVHVKYDETGSMVMSGVLGLMMAFIAYGRTFVHPVK